MILSMRRCQLLKFEELRDLPAFGAMSVDYCALARAIDHADFKGGETVSLLAPGFARHDVTTWAQNRAHPN